jgi:hypothetical protein
MLRAAQRRHGGDSIHLPMGNMANDARDAETLETL